MRTNFPLINANPNIEGLQLFSQNFLYSAYADNTTSFLRNEKSKFELINTFDTFSLFFLVLKSTKEGLKLLVSVSKRGFEGGTEWNIII